MARNTVSIPKIDSNIVRFKDQKGKVNILGLHSNLITPAATHGYSLGIEYMKKWFLEKFHPDYFSYVYINGKHVLDDYKNFNNHQLVRKEPPLLAITPTIDYDYDREYQDVYQSSPEIYLKRSSYEKAFFRDYQRNLHLGLQMRALRMNFNFKIRVRTRAEQTDLFRSMELKFRIGSTQTNYISADFLIPKHVILDIATKAGFDIDKSTMQIVDILSFLNYMNKRSIYPIMFKMRAVNQQPEFFLRMVNIPVHISCVDKISADDGEKSGHVDTNFHLEFQAVMTMPVPHFYIYYSADEYTYSIKMDSDKNKIGVYSFCPYEIPNENEKGWRKLVVTSYICDAGEKEIDLSPIFNGNHNLLKVMRYNLSNFISPDSFIEVKAYHNDDIAIGIETKMDYQTGILHILSDIYEDENINIVVFADQFYVNDTMITIENYDKNRLSNIKETLNGTSQTYPE